MQQQNIICWQKINLYFDCRGQINLKNVYNTNHLMRRKENKKVIGLMGLFNH